MTDKGINRAPWERSFERILTPLEEFIHRQTTSGILLMFCAVVALAIANSPLHEAYEQLLQLPIGFSAGGAEFSLTVHYWINEALMAMFFFIIGLELKRELTVGELSTPRQALLPLMAAVGGMAIPALFYILVNGSGPGFKGWGIPMATDIAFAIGALSLLGSRVPKNLVTFLIALAIVDDLGAVAVIAVYYTEDINSAALAYATGFAMLLAVLNRGGFRGPLPYAVVGICLWGAMLSSGVHATLAGVIVAFMIPIRPKFEPEHFIERVEDSALKMRKSTADGTTEGTDIIHNNRFRALVTALGDGVTDVQAPAQRMEHAMHLPVAFLVIPIFALANAGIPIDSEGFGRFLSSPIGLGVLAGLLLGKPVGITGFTWITLKLGWAKLPPGITLQHIFGVSLLAGIGFTMSIFIA
ncbi:MAG: Na+/H+ antiporter NhaA, partial [Xanthomonadales bacterium]|nr:Na+/H+ antiporter NhaA [Xanthomonadales bacterium]